MRSLPKTMEYLATVVIQDACEMYDEYSTNDVHGHLWLKSEFRYATLYD
jgi:hypothetical protein